MLQGSPGIGFGEPVGPLMGGKIAQAAVMTTSVASVRDPIQPLDARDPTPSEGYDTPPYPNLICSPIDLVPKKVEGEFRLIHHLSYPHGSSVNDGIPNELTSMSYATLDDAINEIRELGKGAFIAKSDIESAFRLIPIKKQDYHLLGFQWKDEFFFEKVLPMGCASSCQLFESFSSALEFIFKYQTQSNKVLHVLMIFCSLVKVQRNVNIY